MDIFKDKEKAERDGKSGNLATRQQRLVELERRRYRYLRGFRGYPSMTLRLFAVDISVLERNSIEEDATPKKGL